MRHDAASCSPRVGCGSRHDVRRRELDSAAITAAERYQPHCREEVAVDVPSRRPGECTHAWKDPALWAARQKSSSGASRSKSRTAGCVEGTSSPPSARWRSSSRPAGSRSGKRIGRSRSRGCSTSGAVPKAAHSFKSSITNRSAGRFRSCSASARPSHKELTEARMLIEPPIARLAALRARPDDIAKLERVLIQEEEEVQQRVRAIPSGTGGQVPSRRRRLRAQPAAGRADERAGRSHREIGIEPGRQGPRPPSPQELRVPSPALRRDPQARRSGGLHPDGAARRRHSGTRGPHRQAAGQARLWACDQPESRSAAAHESGQRQGRNGKSERAPARTAWSKVRLGRPPAATCSRAPDTIPS